MHKHEIEIEDGEFEEIVEARDAAIQERLIEETQFPDVMRITDLPDADIKRIKEAQMSEEHNHFNDELDPTSLSDKKPSMTNREIYSAITSAFRTGAIDSRERNRMMKTMGVSKNDFVKSKITKTTKSKKRKSQKAARRNNRK